jgi:II/X family phage/plasmid replication protein
MTLKMVFVRDKMIDTIRIASPILPLAKAKKIESVARVKMGIDMEFGEIMYQITTKQLQGSWDSSLSLQVKYERFDTDSDGIPRLIKCGPYLIIEASIHKLVFGHNVFCGWDNFDKAAKYLVDFTATALEIELPDYHKFEVQRVDISENYYLGEKDAVNEWFQIMKLKKYPRRKPKNYDDTGLYFSGSSTTWKAYSKGDDFRKHEYKRIKRFRGKEVADRLQMIANNVIRFEIEVRLRKLKYDMQKNKIYVKDIKDDYLKDLFEKENERVIREGEDVKIVNNTYDVRTRLYSELTNRKARTLLGTWMQMAALGEQQTQDSMCRTTFYRHRKELIDLGISWNGTDISIQHAEKVPIEFKPNLKSKFLLTYEAGLELKRLVG